MADQLTSAGLEIDSLETRIDSLIGELRTRIAPTLDASADTPEGQFIRIFAESAQSVAELVQVVYAAQYPDGATGFSLDALARLTGTERRAATKSSLTDVTVNIDAGTYAVGTLKAHVVGIPTSRFVSTEEAVNAGPGAANVDIDFEAETAGIVAAPTGTLTVIAEPVTGWNSITNSTDAVVGSDVETDIELRIRRIAELQTGASNVNAIITAVSQVTGVAWVGVTENDSDVTVGGVPAHSIKVYVHKTTATDLEVGTAIFDAKAAGIGTAGTTEVYVPDSMGEYHTVKFESSNVVEYYIEIDVTVSVGEYGGDAAVKDALVAWQEIYLGIGETIYQSQMIHAVMDGVTGIVDVSEIRIGTSSSPTWTDDVDQDDEEYASFAIGRITVTSV